MPNWCTNEVDIYGHKNVKQFKQFVDECIVMDFKLDFEKVIPYPPECPSRDDITLDSTMEERMNHPYQKWYSDFGYDWCIDNWGTKWHPSEEDGDVLDDEAHLVFDTAWGPPVGIYNKLVEKYPDLNFSWFYKEEGMQISGWLPE